MKNKIDIIVPWVDGNDQEWLKEKKKYKDPDSSDYIRFRDWGLMRYFFRGIEQYANWVNKVFFVTWGHVPEWLNLQNPRLKVIKHEDYIPREFLPTFSSHTIELNFHRISDLSEEFVYFNDDMFLINPTDETDFFVDGKPCDMAVLYPNYVDGVNSEFDHIFLNNAELFSRHFDIKKIIKNNRKQWINPAYGVRNNMKTMCMMLFPFFTGIMLHHQPQSLKKSILSQVWENEHELLTEVCTRKFRSGRDVNQYVFRYWQLGTGQFYPYNLHKRGQYYSVSNELNIDNILNSSLKTICLNDSIPDLDYEKVRSRMINAFEKKLNNKSSFEI